MAGLPIYHCIPDWFSDSQPTFKLPVEDLIETVISLNFLLLPKFSAWKTLMPSVKSSAPSSLAASWHILSLFLSIAPTPHHPPIPTGPHSALQRGFPSSPKTWGDSRVLLLSKTQVLQCSPTASLSMAVWLKVWAHLLLASEHSLVLLQLPSFSSGCWTQGRLTKTLCLIQLPWERML